MISSCGTDFSGGPAVHPDGSRVLFESDADGKLNIWVMDTDGNNRRQLTFTAAQDFYARWSPDGESIAYASESEGDLQIWLMDAEGRNARKLTSAGNTNYSPSWSPDGAWVSYLSTQGDSTFVFKVPVDGGEPVRMSDRSVFVVADWSPDGRWIATWSRGNPATPQQELLLIPTDGSDEVRSFTITIRSGNEMLGLRWLPDTSAVSYVFRKDGTPNLQQLPLDGGEPRTLTAFDGDETIFNYDWSPDGQFIVAQRGVTSSDIVLLENVQPTP